MICTFAEDRLRENAAGRMPMRQQCTSKKGATSMPVDPVSLEVFRHRCTAVAEEMGTALGRTAFSANIKERRDYSCAVFDAHGRMIAQAAHIPVHLGAMPRSVEAALAHHTLQPGDMVILNDPYLGGSHLPDITLVAPVFVPAHPAADAPLELLGYVASRAHHADVGGITPGSMPMSQDIYQEGFIIPPLLIQQGGVLNEPLVTLICRNSRTPDERRGDLAAQRACHTLGERRLHELVAGYGMAWVREHMQALFAYGERSARSLLAALPDGHYQFEDVLDDDGTGNAALPIRVAVTIQGEQVTVDFRGSAPQSGGPVNAPLAVVESAVFYCFRCLGGSDMPDAAIGALHAVAPPLIVPAGSLLNPHPPAAVAGGNVETSQRVVDVVLGALAQAVPQCIPAASAGTMNNWTCGGINPASGAPFAYYETLGGGMGARTHAPGLDGLQIHMTNTLNTPVEALEHLFPLRVRRYGLRCGSGGAGAQPGGEGLIREVEFLAPASISLLTERRTTQPYGLHGGAPGAAGRNTLIRADGSEHPLPGKVSLQVAAGDCLRIETPGGGGYGAAEA
jgi:N-methylhydantoinase B